MRFNDFFYTALYFDHGFIIEKTPALLLPQLTKRGTRPQSMSYLIRFLYSITGTLIFLLSGQLEQPLTALPVPFPCLIHIMKAGRYQASGYIDRLIRIRTLAGERTIFINSHYLSIN